MHCDWATGWTIGLLIILFLEIFLGVTPIGRSLDDRWIQPIANMCFDWLWKHLQASYKSLKEIIDATHNSSALETRYYSPQFIVFPKIKYLLEYEKPTAAQRVQFLSLPLELRLKVYGFFFATELYNPFELGIVHSVHQATTSFPCSTPVLKSLTSYWPIVKIRHSKEATANSKLPLLLVNKKINTEARPLFYRHHTFQMECKQRRISEIHLTRRARLPLNWITKMELTNSKHHFPLFPRAKSLHHQLRLLDESCFRLRSLKIDYHTSAREKPLPGIPDFWARLVYIEMRITRWERSSDEMMVRWLEPVAPAKDWRKVGVKKLDGYYFRSNGVKQRILGVPQHIFRLDRVGAEEIS